MKRKQNTINHELVWLVAEQLRNPVASRETWPLQLEQLFRGVFHKDLEQWVISSCFGQDLRKEECDFQVGEPPTGAQIWLNAKVRSGEAITFTKLLASPNPAYEKAPLVLPSIFYKFSGKCASAVGPRLKCLHIEKLLNLISQRMPKTAISEEKLEEIHKGLLEKDVITEEMSSQLRKEIDIVRGRPLAAGEFDINKLIPVFMAQHQ
ncbi:MAG: hypothetical protein Q7R35_02695, partial [Elusimicrobiota bacterium]|nr:hypothetical protein [Elusimicrobiota bacterium]